MTKQNVSRDFEVALSGLTAGDLAVLLEAAQALKAAQDAGDPRPPEVVVAHIAKRAGIDWPPKEDEAHDGEIV